MNSLKFIDLEIARAKSKYKEHIKFGQTAFAIKDEKRLQILQQIKFELVALESLKSKLYLPEENECDTLDDGSKVYMIYTKGVWSEEEYKALKRVA